MPNPTPNTTGLKPFTASDTAGGTVPLAAKISPDDRDWLDSLPKGRSCHVRQAIKVYRQLKEGNLSIGQPRTQQLLDLEADRQARFGGCQNLGKCAAVSCGTVEPSAFHSLSQAAFGSIIVTADFITL